MHYLLFYEVGEDYVSGARSFGMRTLNWAGKQGDRGELVLAAR